MQSQPVAKGNADTIMAVFRPSLSENSPAKGPPISAPMVAAGWIGLEGVKVHACVFFSVFDTHHNSVID